MILKNKSKKTIELVEHFEKNLKNLDQQKKIQNIIDLNQKKKNLKKKHIKKNFFIKKNNPFCW